MSRRKSTIFLGDLANAIRKLNASDFATQKLVAELLGMELSVPVIDLPAADPVQTFVPTPVPPLPAEMPLAPEPEPGKTIDDSIPITINHTVAEKSDWISEVQPLPNLRPENQRYIHPSLEPLLLPQWTRGILVASLATTTEDGLPDLDRITRILARGEAITQLPTLSSPTLRRGIQLLIDKSQAMAPFTRDQHWLQNEIRNVVGKDRVQTMRFTGTPERGCGSGPQPWPDYAAPAPGTPVVLLTDLGICQPMLANDWADTHEWRRFCETVHHANCPLIAFVPFGRARWPPQLARALTIIQWDRQTSASTVRSLTGRGLEVAAR